MRGGNGRGLSDHELSKLLQTLPPLNSSTAEDAETKLIAVAWKEHQVPFPNLYGEQNSVLNAIVKTIQPRLAWGNVERLLSEVPSSPSALSQLREANIAVDFKQPYSFLLDAPEGTGKHTS